MVGIQRGEHGMKTHEFETRPFQELRVCGDVCKNPATLLRTQLAIVIAVEAAQRCGSVGDLSGRKNVIAIGIKSSEYRHHLEVDRRVVALRLFGRGASKSLDLELAGAEVRTHSQQPQEIRPESSRFFHTWLQFDGGRSRLLS